MHFLWIDNTRLFSLIKIWLGIFYYGGRPMCVGAAKSYQRVDFPCKTTAFKCSWYDFGGKCTSN